MTADGPKAGVPSCWYCRHSIGMYQDARNTLWCELNKREALKVCAEYEREPGADEWEGEE